MGDVLRREPKPIDLPEEGKRRRRSSKKLELSEETVGHLVCVAFGGIAVATRHKHWVKTTEKVRPITEPLTRMLNSLPPAVIDRLERHIDPALLVYGLVTVALPDVMVEIEVRKLQRERMATLPFQPPPFQSPTSSPPSQPTVVREPNPLAADKELI